MNVLAIAGLIVIALFYLSIPASAAKVEIYFDSELTQTSFCGYEDMAGDTLKIYMVAEEVGTLSGATFAVRGSFCNSCMWDIRGTHYPAWVTSSSGLPFDTVGAEIHGDPQPGPRVLLAILDAVILSPGSNESTTACSAAGEGQQLGYWDESQTFAQADSACGWVYRICPPAPIDEGTWSQVKQRFLGVRQQGR